MCKFAFKADSCHWLTWDQELMSSLWRLCFSRFALTLASWTITYFSRAEKWHIYRPHSFGHLKNRKETIENKVSKYKDCHYHQFGTDNHDPQYYGLWLKMTKLLKHRLTDRDLFSLATLVQYKAMESGCVNIIKQKCLLIKSLITDLFLGKKYIQCICSKRKWRQMFLISKKLQKRYDILFFCITIYAYASVYCFAEEEYSSG